MAPGVAGIILFLIPVLILAQINHERNVSVTNRGSVRFGFGGVQMLSGILKAACKEKCPRNQRFFMLDTTKIFCAVNCPMESNPVGSNINVTIVNSMMPSMIINGTMPGMPGGKPPDGTETDDTKPDDAKPNDQKMNGMGPNPNDSKKNGTQPVVPNPDDSKKNATQSEVANPNDGQENDPSRQ